MAKFWNYKRRKRVDKFKKDMKQYFKDMVLKWKEVAGSLTHTSLSDLHKDITGHVVSSIFLMRWFFHFTRFLDGLIGVLTFGLCYTKLGLRTAALIARLRGEQNVPQ